MSKIKGKESKKSEGKTIHVRLNDETYKLLKKKADRLGVSISTYVKIAITRCEFQFQETNDSWLKK